MKILICALLAGVMVLVRPCGGGEARADQASEEHAAADVFRAMHRDLERCFSRSDANAFVSIEALVDEEGRVRAVTTRSDRGSAIVARRCIERRVARARFPPPRGGGTSRVRISFVFAYD